MSYPANSDGYMARTSFDSSGTVRVLVKIVLQEAVFREVVDDGDVIARAEQLSNGVRADETSSTEAQHFFHRMQPCPQMFQTSTTSSLRAERGRGTRDVVRRR